MVTRRRFIGMSAAAATGTAVGGAALWAGLVRDHVEEAARTGDPATGPNATDRSSRVLVVVQMGGGNDGLATLVPADGRLRDARPTLALPEAELVALPGADGWSLHPALAPLVPHWTDGRLVAVEGVAMPDQSRSHFAAMDTWWAGSPAASTSGWLGRWLDATAPEGAPNPLRAIALGGTGAVLVGERTLPTVVLDPAQFSLRTPKGCSPEAITAAFLACAAPAGATAATDPTLAAAQQAFPDTVAAIEALARARSAGSAGSSGSTTPAPTSVAPPTSAAPERAVAADGPLTTLLGSAAGIIEQGLGTRVLFVSTSGYDTHADQRARQQRLLADLAVGLDRFLGRIAAAGRADDVVVLTTSEFGRRVAENASGGTDHGDAGVAFLAGGPVVGGRVVGEARLDALVEGDLPLAVDGRSLDAAVLDWLGGPTDEVLRGSFDRLGLLRP